MKLLMLKGLPGSGKSTWAKNFLAQNPKWVRVNKDSLRDMMGGYSQQKEKLVLALRNSFISNAFERGLSVVVDDTNFAPAHEETLRHIAELFKVDFEIQFFDVPVKECIANDLKRQNSVGEKVIRRMWSQYLAPKVEKPAYDPNLPDAIICDLDGTLAIHNGRSPYDTDKCDTDEFNEVVYNLLAAKHFESGHEIIFVSGREDTYKEKTVVWLRRRFSKSYTDLIYMRPAGDKREDSIVKQELYETYIKGKYNVEFVLDDRNRVVEMWRRNGLTCLQVAEGDF